MKKGKLAVVALGGNAIIRSDQDGRIEEQNQNVRDTLENLFFLIDAGYNLVLTHGNGPQVGNILMRNDAGFLLYDIAQMPLDICVADSQGGIGYMIERELRNLLESRNIEKDIVTMVTQVVVSKDDPSIQNPSKRIGKSYTKEEAEGLSDDKGWVFKISQKNQKYRRVVPSPQPLKIFNTESIQRIATSGSIVIAVGGGGIPVYIDENGLLQPVEGVIDKDLASSLLATQIGADELYVLTDVPYIYINFNKENQEIIEFLDIADTERYIEEGHFGEGSMGPKVKAALSFVKNGGEKSVITEATKLSDKNFGSKITDKYDT